MPESKCKICRRYGTKLFLRGEKCLSPKCVMIKKSYAPGPKKKKRRGGVSEYGKELREKQKLRNWYNLSEGQFKKYVKKALMARGKVADAAAFLVKTLESRLDNAVFRLGFAPSRAASRQMISHRHFLVNDKPMNISSYLVKKGDRIILKPSSQKKIIFKDINTILKKQTPPTWLQLDIDKKEGKVVAEPSLEEAIPPAEISAIFEFYSR